MLEVMGFGVGLMALLAIGLVPSLVFVLAWVVTLPFRLLGFAFKLIAALLALPFLLGIAIVGALLFGAGLLVFLIPAVPFLLIGLAAFALLRRERRTSGVA